MFNTVIVPGEFSARKRGALEMKEGPKALGQNVQLNWAC